MRGTSGHVTYMDTAYCGYAYWHKKATQPRRAEWQLS